MPAKRGNDIIRGLESLKKKKEKKEFFVALAFDFMNVA